MSNDSVYDRIRILKKKPINPEDWKIHNTYYYKHVDTGEVIHEETYEQRIEERKVLDKYFKYGPYNE